MAARLFFAVIAATMIGLPVASAAAQERPAERQQAFKHRAELAKAVADERRRPENRLRDRYRHPLETLSFFRSRAQSCGGRDLAEQRLVHRDSGALSEGRAAARYSAPRWPRAADRRRPVARRPIPSFTPGSRLPTFPAFDATATRVPDGSADVVLTFRNVHNWRMG